MKNVSVLLLTIMLVVAAVPAFAQDTHHDCPHGGATIAALRSCVEHAVMMGHISSGGVANSLFAKLDAAQAALDRGQPDVAINKLSALVNAVEAQSGKHIAEHHAGHMLNHIQSVIAALGG
jgi:hypothetical protein